MVTFRISLKENIVQSELWDTHSRLLDTLEKQSIAMRKQKKKKQRETGNELMMKHKLTVPSTSLTSTDANSHESEGKLQKKKESVSN